MLNFIHTLYWGLLFFIGVIHYMGFPTAIYKLGVPFLGLILFLLTLFKKGKEIKFPFLIWMVLFVIVSVFSKMLNETKPISLAFFLFYMLTPYLYFIVMINEDSVQRINKITKTIVVLILIQIPASIIKLILIGQSEKGPIGTISDGLGSFSTVFPVLIIAFLISFYLFSNKPKYMILVLFFILFGIIGEKRAITFIIPMEVVLGYFLFVKYFTPKVDMAQVKKFFMIGILGLIAFYFMVRTAPSLNKEKSNWGTFDIEYLVNFSQSYTSSDGKDEKQMRRKDGLIYFLNYISNEDFPTMMLGDGAGILVQSSFDKKSGTMEELYDVRYGGRMGFIWLILQVGYVGVFIYLGFLARFNFVLIKQLPLKNNYLLLGFLISSIFMFIDTIIYSNTFIKFEIVKSIYFYVGALLFLQMRILKSNKNKNVKLLYVNTPI